MSTFNKMMAEVKKADELDAVSAAFGSAFVMGANAAASAPAAAAPAADAKDPKAVAVLKELQAKWFAQDVPGMLAMLSEAVIVEFQPKSNLGSSGFFWGKPGFVNFLKNLGKDFHFDAFAFHSYGGTDKVAYDSARNTRRFLKSGCQVAHGRILQCISINDDGLVEKIQLSDLTAAKTKFASENHVVCMRTKIPCKPGSQDAIKDYMNGLATEMLGFAGLLGIISFFEGDTLFTNAFYKNKAYGEASSKRATEIFGGMKEFMAGAPERKCVEDAVYWDKGAHWVMDAYIFKGKVKLAMTHDEILNHDAFIGLYTKGSSVDGGHGNKGFGQIWDDETKTMESYSIWASEEEYKRCEAALGDVWKAFGPAMAGPPERSGCEGMACGMSRGCVSVIDIEFVSAEAKAMFTGFNKMGTGVMRQKLDCMMDMGDLKARYFQIQDPEDMVEQMKVFISQKEMMEGFMAGFKMWDHKFYGNITDGFREVMDFFTKNYGDKCKMVDANSTLGDFAKFFFIGDGYVNDAMFFMATGKMKDAKGMMKHFHEMAKLQNAKDMHYCWLPMGGDEVLYLEVSTKEEWVANQSIMGNYAMANKMDFGDYFESWTYSPMNPDADIKEMCKPWAAQPWCSIAYPTPAFLSVFN